MIVLVQSQVRGTAMSSLSEAALWRVALELLSTTANVISYNCCITVLGKAKRWQMAQSLLKDFSANSVSYAALAAAFEEAAEWLQALRLLQDLTMDVYTWNSAISACAARSR